MQALDQQGGGIWDRMNAPIAARAAIEARVEELGRRFPDDDAVPTPTNWGGRSSP